MIKCQLAMLAFMFCCQGLMAQNSLRVDASLVDTASVIRAWRGDTAVVCVTDGRGTSHFILESAHSGNLKVVDGPTDFRVVDFRVFHDSVFFCGIVVPNDLPVFGFFDIAAFFAGTGVCSYCAVPPFVSPDPFVGYYGLSEPLHMDVFSYDDTTHIAFVGKSNLHPTPGACPRTTVGDVYYDGFNWKCKVLYNKDGRDVYTDIAVGKDYIVAVARDDSALTANVKPYYKSRAFVNMPIVSGIMFRINDLLCEGGVSVECVGGNHFALAYQFMSGRNLGSTLKTFDVYPSLTISESIKTIRGPIYPGGPCRIRQMQYNPNGDFLYILQDAPVQSRLSIESIVSRYRLASLSGGIGIMRIVNNWKSFGLCVHGGNTLHASGCDLYSKFGLWVDLQNSNACSQRLDESYDYTLPSVSKPLMSDFCTDLPAGGGTWSPVVRDEKSEYICGM